MQKGQNVQISQGIAKRHKDGSSAAQNGLFKQGGGDQIFTSPSSSPRQAAAVPWVPESPSLPFLELLSFQCRRDQSPCFPVSVRAVAEPSRPYLHSASVTRATALTEPSVSIHHACTSPVRSLPRPEPILPWPWFILVPCPALGVRVSLD